MCTKQRRWLSSATTAEAKRDPAWAVLRTIPFLGPVRAAAGDAADAVALPHQATAVGLRGARGGDADERGVRA